MCKNIEILTLVRSLNRKLEMLLLLLESFPDPVLLLIVIPRVSTGCDHHKSV